MHKKSGGHNTTRSEEKTKNGQQASKLMQKEIVEKHLNFLVTNRKERR